ncbi:porin [Herminiimonas sp.]|uniref:porin n=1 Tax=Herminiimonas sp. TaxID=1926289 RepID=UPI0027212798|nr:porin [Herminiimonas sp.]MDO8304373.1 porin [Herminiimonas sp.]
MKIPFLMFALASALAGTVDAQPSMTIYGTFKKDGSTQPLDAAAAKSAFINDGLSSINMYGTIDGGIRHVTNTTAAGGGTTTQGSNGEYYNNRLGIKGKEDLGGGLNAHFHLESGFNTGTGALDNTANRLFNRISSIGIAGSFGSIDFGRQPSVACKAVYSYEPFQYRYVHIIPLAGAVAGNLDGRISRPFGTADGPRFSNGIQYFGKFGSFTTSAEYIMGEVPGSNRNQAAKAVGLVYNDGTFTIGGAYTKQKPNIAAVGTLVPDYQDQNQITFGGGYKIDALRITGGYLKTTTAITSQAKNIWLGARYDFTPTTSLTAGYYRTTLETAQSEIARRNLLIVGATYALSPRTSLYADIDQAVLHGIVSLTPGRQTRQTGISAGISHMF